MKSLKDKNFDKMVKNHDTEGLFKEAKISIIHHCTCHICYSCKCRMAYYDLKRKYNIKDGRGM